MEDAVLNTQIVLSPSENYLKCKQQTLGVSQAYYYCVKTCLPSDFFSDFIIKIEYKLRLLDVLMLTVPGKKNEKVKQNTFSKEKRYETTIMNFEA